MEKKCLAAIAFAVFCAAAQGYNAFTNSHGYWNDVSNWASNYVPNSPTEILRIEQAASITNDIEGVEFTKLYCAGETRIYGLPVSIAGGMRHLDNQKNLYFLCPVSATNGLTSLTTAAIHFCATNKLSRLDYTVGTAHTFAFHSTTADGPTTNWNFPPMPFTADNSQPIDLVLYGNSVTKPVQELSSVRVNQQMLTVNADSYSKWRFREVAATGHIRAHNGMTEVVDSRAGVGAWRIDENTTVRFLEPSTRKRPAGMPDVHLDASRADLFEYLDGDPSKGVVRWNGVNGHGYAYHDLQEASDGTRVMPMRVENTLNGMAVVDFGDTYNKGYSPASERAKGGYLILDKGSNADYRAWTIFIVECCQNFVWGANNASGIMHGSDSWNGNLGVNRNETHADFRDGSALVRLNGETVSPFSARLSGKGVYDVLAVRMANSATYVGRLAWDRSYRTGAARIAEVLVYTRKLTDDEFYATEQYLREKWKGVPATAVSGPDHSAETVHFPARTSNPVEVAPGAEAVVGEIGGRWSGGLAGGGRLEAKRGMAGQIQPFAVEDGTLALSSASGGDLPASSSNPITDTFFHLDADAADTFTLGPDGEVLEWRDVNYSETGRAAYSPNDSDNPPPHRVQGVLNGRPAVDSGVASSGRVLLWNHTNTTIRCVFLVYAWPAGDSNEFLVGDTYRNNLADFHRGPNSELFYPGYAASGIKSANADVRVNGSKVANVLGKYLPPDQPAVVAIKLAPGTTASAAAFFVDRWDHPSNGKKFRSGAQALCEAVFYDRTLDESEFEAVQTHLIRKWLPSTPPSFDLPQGEEAFTALDSKSSDGAAKIDVASGDTVTVGPLEGKDWTKTGGGTLVAHGVTTPDGTLSVAEGEFKLGVRDLPAAWAPPPGAFRIDASDASTFTLSGDAVLSVRDADGGAMSAFAPTNNGSILSPHRVARDDLGGLCALDFGDFGTSSGTYGNCLLWERPDDSIRTVFLVVNAERGFGMPLGSKTESNGADFRRQTASTTSPIWDGNASAHVRDGLTYVDGAPTQISAAFPSGWHVLTVQTTGKCRASAFAADMYDTNGAVPARLARMGGVLIAEAIVYDALLLPSMRRDIEAYLMRKWLGSAPAGYAGGASHVGRLSMDGGSLTVAQNVGELDVGVLVGSNNLAVADGMALVVEDLSSYEGVLCASSGAVRVTGIVRSTEDSVPQEGIIAHFDMSAVDLLETYEENGTNFVTRWNDRTGNHYAYADPTNRPWVLKGDCNGLDVLCTGPFCQSGQATMSRLPRAGWLKWDNTGCQAKTVIEVIGLQEGGGFLVSCGPGMPCLHRGGSTGISYNDAIMASNRSEPGESLYSADAFFSINGDRVPYTQGFPSASYHSFAVRVDDTKSPGYLYIGQFGKDRTYRWGGQRVCEVIAYDRCLSDVELARLEAYLQMKWFGRQYRNYVADGLGAIELSDGAVLDLCGETRTASTVAGSGVVSNGTLRVAERLAPGGMAVDGSLELLDGAVLAVDLSAGAVPLTVDGTAAFGSSGTFVVTLPASDRWSERTLLTAESVSGGFAGWTVQVTPALPSGVGCKVWFADGALKFKALNPGSIFIFK